jgi:hypothetical protein
MELLSFKLPVALRRRLAAEARRRGVSQASVIRASLESALVGRPAGVVTCADLAGKLAGSVRGGPRDASTNKRHLDEAVLADYLKRPRKRRRSRAIQDAVAEKLARMERSRLAAECAKLDPEFEKALAEEGLSRELDTCPD